METIRNHSENSAADFIEKFYQQGSISPEKNAFHVTVDRFVNRKSGQAREITGYNPEDLDNILFVEPDFCPYEEGITAPCAYTGKGTKTRKSGVQKTRHVDSTGTLKIGENPWEDVRAILIGEKDQDVLENRPVTVSPMTDNLY